MSSDGNNKIVAAKASKAEFDAFSTNIRDKPLWLEIARYLNMLDLNQIDSIPELQGIAGRVRAERETIRALRLNYVENLGCNVLDSLDHSYSSNAIAKGRQKLLREVETKGDLWCVKVLKGTGRSFDQLCKHAGIKKSKGKPSRNQRCDPDFFYWVSEDADVCLQASLCQVRSNQVMYFEIYGKRKRFQKLVSWFHDNA